MNKIVSLRQAVELVESGTVLALGGMTLYRRPVAFIRALLAAGVRDLTLLALTCGFESDLLVGAGRVRQVRTCYFGLEGFGLAPMFTQWSTAGDLEVVEETEASLAFGLRATLAGVGFMPSQAWIGTDLPQVRPDVKTVRDPYSERVYTAFPALSADTAVIHAVEADRLGNARVGGNLALDRELATVAGQTIVTAECIVDELSGRADLPGVRTTAIVEAPRGAWPTSCYPLYPVDGEEILTYLEQASSGRFGAYLQRFLAAAQDAEQSTGR
jgi:glutaconate CoA-transferase, subunit A